MAAGLGLREWIRQEAQLDGKFLVRVSGDQLSAENAALGYKRLWQIEHVCKDLKHVIDVRPLYHRLEGRIRAHVRLCWLAMLLIRPAENETGQTCYQMRRHLWHLEVWIQLPPRYIAIHPTSATP